jgi:uncharacterized 2Fe-2S/4Fe-4S cluster protein (DUF4445 family)
MPKVNVNTKRNVRNDYRMPPRARARKKVWLNVLPEDIWIKVDHGITIYEALRNTDADLNSECDGLGTCGKCKVGIITAIGAPDDQEKKLLSDDELAGGLRLACRVRVTKDMVVHTGALPGGKELFQILKHGLQRDLEIDPLVDLFPLSVAPPDLTHSDSDFNRLRKALGPRYHNLTITGRCLASLYRNLRHTRFRGEALLHHQCLLAWSPPGSVNGRYGLVFDIGTTTLVGKLIRLSDGHELGVISRLNSQIRYGTNIIARIQHVREKKGGLKRLRELLMRDLNLIIKRLLVTFDLKAHNIFVAVAAGNTTMQHLLLGLDPSGIAEAPFTPVITEGVAFRTDHLGLHMNPEAMLYVLPAKSGYIGGDLTGFILASGAAEEDEKIILGLDIGTNGEIFLGNRHRMLTCSAAAGPALEGARITHGMIAKAGAIEGFRVEERHLQYNVIGNVKPKGICGSGLVDLAAVLLHYGVIDREGLIGPDRIREAGELFESRLVARNPTGLHDFVVAAAEETAHEKQILLCQKDVRELQLAKSAIAAGTRLLMRELGVTVDDVDQICLAGALGNYMNPYSAMRIGLIPRVNPEKVVPLGNAAATGASMVLLCKQYWARSVAVADRLEHLELSVHPDFYELFVEEMDFQEQNIW